MEDKVANALTVLADKLGVTVEYLWGVLVKQAQLEFYTDFIFYGITIVLCVVCFFFVRKAIRYLVSDDAPDSEYTMICYFFSAAILSIVTLICVTTALFTINDTVTKRYNPEYWALQKVLSSIRR